VDQVGEESDAAAQRVDEGLDAGGDGKQAEAEKNRPDSRAGAEDLGIELTVGVAVAHRRQAAVTGFVRLPRPSISIVISSPGCMNTFGSRKAPTPAGVPVAIRSPGSSVIVCVT